MKKLYLSVEKVINKLTAVEKVLRNAIIKDDSSYVKPHNMKEDVNKWGSIDKLLLFINISFVHINLVKNDVLEALTSINCDIIL